MKYLLFVLVLNVLPLVVVGQNVNDLSSVPNPAKNILVVEASCGQCQFGLKKEGCNLAIRIEGQAYFVTGTDIDSHGDAHAKDGFCERIKLAEVQGDLLDGQYKLSYFKLQKDSINNK